MKVINDSEYGHLICGWFQRQFPLSFKAEGKDLLNILTDLLVSTKENRYGSLPSPESLVEIRKVIQKSIDLDHPIPILIAWGGRKAVLGNQLDIAEISAINQLVKLDNCIKQFYSPGLFINIRIEDTGAYWIYREEKDVSDEAIISYSHNLTYLIHTLRGNSIINPIRETELMDTQKYYKVSQMYSDLLDKVLLIQTLSPSKDIEEVPEWKELIKRGWKGNILDSQRKYYLDRYADLYPESTIYDNIKRLADYFGGAKARYDLNGRANPHTRVNDHINISFVPPIPGAPESMFNKTLYWRTVPSNQGRTHIAPWRAKGYFRIQGNDITSKITSFRDPLIAEMDTCTTIITSDNDTINNMKPKYNINLKINFIVED